jgi:hypothetical protein
MEAWVHRKLYQVLHDVLDVHGFDYVGYFFDFLNLYYYLKFFRFDVSFGFLFLIRYFIRSDFLIIIVVMFFRINIRLRLYFTFS